MRIETTKAQLNNIATFIGFLGRRKFLKVLIVKVTCKLENTHEVVILVDTV